LLDYDPDTGILIWRHRDIAWFGTRRTGNTWNTRYAGKPALTALRHGYFHGDVLGQQFPAHRVIWKWMTGSEPQVIDHINGHPNDNRWCNLRSGTRGDNSRNLKLPKSNTSGRIGVSRCKRGRPWQAYIRASGKRISLGTFESFEDAVAARQAAERKYGYHENHGRRAEPVKDARVVVIIA
jgi:hypothetical protein